MRAPRLSSMLPFLVLVLAGCPPGPGQLEDPEELIDDGCDENWIGTTVHDQTFKLPPYAPAPGLAWSVEWTVPVEFYGGVGSRLRIDNHDPDQDCMVAFYVGDEEPWPEALPALPLGEEPPPVVDGLGELADRASVPRAWDGNGTWDSGYVALSTDDQPGMRYLTLAACEGADLTVGIETYARHCSSLSDMDVGAIVEAVTVEVVF